MANAPKEQSDRQDDRLPFFDIAILVLEDSREISCTATDMGLGGAFLNTQKSVTGLAKGDRVKIRLDLFGRSAEFACHVAHVRPEGVGVQITRSSLP